MLMVGLTTMAGNAVPYLKAQIESRSAMVGGQSVNNPQAVQFMLKKKSAVLLPQALIQGSFTTVAKGGMPQIMAQGNSLDQIRVQAKDAPNGVGNIVNRNDMLHTGADVVVLRIEEHLSFVAHATEVHGKNNTPDIPFKTGADRTGIFSDDTSTACAAAGSIGAKCFFLFLPQ